MYGQTISLLLWLALYSFWLIMARITAQRVSEPPVTGQSRLRRGLSWYANMLAYVLTFWHIDHLLFWRRMYPASPIFITICLVLQAASLFFAVWARLVLGKNWSGVIRKVSGQTLIRTGPYRWLRHPIYSGLLLGFVATSILAGTMAAYAGLLIFGCSFIIKLRDEERFLCRIFGDAYQAYRRESWALIPLLY